MQLSDCQLAGKQQAQTYEKVHHVHSQVTETTIPSQKVIFPLVKE